MVGVLVSHLRAPLMRFPYGMIEYRRRQKREGGETDLVLRFAVACRLVVLPILLHDALINGVFERPQHSWYCIPSG